MGLLHSMFGGGTDMQLQLGQCRFPSTDAAREALSH